MTTGTGGESENDEGRPEFLGDSFASCESYRTRRDAT